MQKPSGDYRTVLAARARSSRVYREHQSTGLALARLLRDARHRVLYIRLAKQYPVSFLMSLAGDVASRGGVKNRGAYFMRLLQQSGRAPRPLRQVHQLRLKLHRKKTSAKGGSN